jgi:hypothetical protein
MKIVICPGMHSPELTGRFVEALGLSLEDLWIVPSDRIPVYSPQHILNFLHSASSPLLFIAFSAGVVGSIGAARLLHRQGKTVKALIAIDGWGVPLFGDFPIHRVSHDYFTHWSSALLGRGSDSFYADPPTDHLTLWCSPQTVQGFTGSVPCSAAHFLTEQIHHYKNFA